MSVGIVVAEWVRLNVFSLILSEYIESLLAFTLDI